MIQLLEKLYQVTHRRGRKVLTQRQFRTRQLTMEYVVELTRARLLHIDTGSTFPRLKELYAAESLAARFSLCLDYWQGVEGETLEIEALGVALALPSHSEIVTSMLEVA